MRPTRSTSWSPAHRRRHVRGDRAARRGRYRTARALRSPRRPLRSVLPPGHDSRRGRRVGRLPGSNAHARRARGGDTLPAHSGCADRARFRTVPCSSRRCDREGRRCHEQLGRGARCSSTRPGLSRSARRRSSGSSLSMASSRQRHFGSRRPWTRSRRTFSRKLSCTRRESGLRLTSPTTCASNLAPASRHS